MSVLSMDDDHVAPDTYETGTYFEGGIYTAVGTVEVEGSLESPTKVLPPVFSVVLVDAEGEVVDTPKDDLVDLVISKLEDMYWGDSYYQTLNEEVRYAY